MYKNLMKVLLSEIYYPADEGIDYPFIEQIILRYAHRSKLLCYDKEESVYYLSNKGKKLLEVKEDDTE